MMKRNLILLFLVTIGLLVTPMSAQTENPITPANANQLTELGRTSFLLDPPLATVGLDLSPDGEQLAMATASGVYLVDIGDFVRSGSHNGFIGSTATILEPTLRVQQPTFSPDGSYLVAMEDARRPAVLFIWDLATLETTYGPAIPPGHYQSFAFRPQTHEVYYSHFVDPVRFNDPESIIPTGILDYFDLGVPANVAFNDFEQPDQQFVIRGFNPAGSQMHYLVHDLNTNETTHHFWDFASSAANEPLFTGNTEATLSPDWTTAAEIDTSAEPAYFLHDLAAKTTTRIIVEADTLSQTLTFSPDSQLIVGTTFTGETASLRLWDATTGTEVAHISLGEFDVIDVFFTADMTRLIARVARSMPLAPEPEQLVVWSIP